jgi:hypothetical protein
MTFENIRLAILELFTTRKTSLEQQIPSATGEALQAMQKERARLNALIPNPAWRPDPAWLAGLPSLLCGPIVRKVLTDEVTVWVALKVPANVTLTVFERKSDGQKGPLSFRARWEWCASSSISHVAAVRAKPASPTSPNKLLRGHIYYYDLAFGSESLKRCAPTWFMATKIRCPAFLSLPST